MKRGQQGVTGHTRSRKQFTRRGDDTVGTGPHSRRHALVLLVALALAVTACGGPAAHAPAAAPAAAAQQPRAQGPADGAQTEAAAAAPEGRGTQAQPRAGVPTSSGAQNRRRTTAAARDETQDGAATSAAPRQPEHAIPEFDRDAVDVDAGVDPECVRPGGDVTISVATRPNAGVGYHAFYADGQGGGPPPYGASYGGNGGDLADEQGRFTDSWTVAPNTPSGPGRVDVVVAHDGEFGRTSVPFAVADPVTGLCTS